MFSMRDGRPYEVLWNSPDSWPWLVLLNVCSLSCPRRAWKGQMRAVHTSRRSLEANHSFLYCRKGVAAFSVYRRACSCLVSCILCPPSESKLFPRQSAHDQHLALLNWAQTIHYEVSNLPTTIGRLSLVSISQMPLCLSPRMRKRFVCEHKGQDWLRLSKNLLFISQAFEPQKSSRD